MAFPIPNSPSSSSLSLSLYLPRSSTTLFLHSHSKFAFRTITFSSLRTTTTNRSSSSKPNTPSAPWLSKSPSPKRVPESTTEDPFRPPTDKGQNAVERIVLRLRNLGLASEEDVEVEDEKEEEEEEVRVDAFPVTGEERLGELLRREWVRPDAMVLDEDEEDEEMVLPWEREKDEKEKEKGGGGDVGLRKRSVKAPTLAELTLEDELLRRLRREGMRVRERISIPKAGLTQDVMDNIHKKWRKEELVRLKFHEDLAGDMKTAHDIVERRTGGLVTWRSGSVMMVYRGSNYQGPASGRELNEKEGDGFFVPDVSEGSLLRTKDSNATSSVEKTEPVVMNREQPENMTEEEAEYNALLDGLGPRFVGWWGTGILPVDADLLPRTVPDYKTPFRLLPTGMRSRLTNAEMTNLRIVAKSLPCHFALGRNRNHQGLACAILKIWEKSLVAKIAVKPGIQNTNNKIMAEELKMLTGGTLLLRNKYYIVIYRGKDFVPTSVAEVLAERQELTKQVQDIEEKVRCRAVDANSLGQGEPAAQAGSLAEFYEAQARWGRDISSEEREEMMEEAAKTKTVRLVKQVEHKLSLAQAKKLRAEKLLAKIEASMVPAGPDYDQETITDEECVVFRRIGLRMKPYLPLGIRGVFDGVIENMHLHWKYRELVKLITKQKTLAFVEDTARLLEYESGGILVAIERVSKGFALIYYRGKNYKRPITLRPRNLLTKAKALKRSVAFQRHEALSQHITELEKTIDQMKRELGMSQDLEVEDGWSIEEEDHNQIDHISEFTQGEDEDSDGFDDEEDDEDSEWEDDEDSEFSKFKNDGHH
ncbi:CRM-domain containing factor CFM3, chloroplastic/mitochondrial [Gastrolobium bilobum]|uniref:CRM-domain containing factor CFM3, chloroplastic/mitochondrial n=1 Tax=Gastrolobium bilobum TaxID=150636 RepID=UPI002AB2F261|nr:CRM-domain containing factor CFM3, chloroplastic/mitochondrial [Gastrolobium bilobum]